MSTKRDEKSSPGLDQPSDNEFVSPLCQFFENRQALPEWDSNKKPVFGRSWLSPELRLKSFDDLHKLYYVCLKELNMLYTQEHESKRTKAIWNGTSRIIKVFNLCGPVFIFIVDKGHHGPDKAGHC